MTSTEPAARPQDLDVARFDKFKWYSASALTSLYFFSVYDQTALPPVAAAIDWTGRFRKDPFGRAARTAAADQIVFFGDEADKAAEYERLRRLHRDVKGVGRSGQKFHAFEPDVWNFILVSTFFAYRNAYEPVTGEVLTSQEEQDFWDFYRTGSAALQLGGNGALPESYEGVRDFYDRMVRTRLAATPELAEAVELLLHPPLPSFAPRIAAPAWALAGPLLGHVMAVLSFGVMHEGVRELTGFAWNWRRDLEFKVLTKGVQVAYRILPKRLQFTPMAYNRWQYERLAKSYRGIGLTSFAPDRAG